MELKKPTLEEVKEYFKDAEIVECAYLKKLYYITKNITSDIRLDMNEYWIKADNTDINLWDNHSGYAKIISYKQQKKFKITKETILKYNMKDEFPEVFETKLEVGKWYKGNVDFESLIFITKIEKCNNEKREYSSIYYYGFASGIYRVNDTIGNKDHEDSLKEATPQEVEEALIQEAKKIGFKDGDYIDRSHISKLLGVEKIDLKTYSKDPKYFYYSKNDCLECHGFVVYSKGRWAEIIPTITKEEAEDKLGCKIVD